MNKALAGVGAFVGAGRRSLALFERSELASDGRATEKATTVPLLESTRVSGGVACCFGSSTNSNQRPFPHIYSEGTERLFFHQPPMARGEKPCQGSTSTGFAPKSR